MKQDFYQKMRSDIREWVKTKTGKENQWSEYLLLAPDLFHLLAKLALDKDLPSSEKAKIAGALAYFISPIDLFPEALIGPLGYLDDVALAAYVINSVMKNCDPGIVTKHWAGEQNILDLVQQIVDVASDMLGNKIWDKLKGMVK
ncbi:MAG: DUF1232 domain-containing protein [Candidatus Marinimicrobia bacterium]|jgi:uncharacterized membrane protein YkvA (DUF1232 family)|nr:DUF1232 domain-containing protein [Candidatus Neomarinimicrobiota bacterium]MBT4362540.1 DUF1232 domain-containing protein [Candidatus Neomarinimicrobiota bacterium]MBT4714879.1 DUF1232 domain-containing protein [Candidatus Neomarinimicrobiota bacterium]MBT4947325.1 DUF1232 domain-containing protein [Candidatus Neomarinimicrobiota bacterium]MBT5269466.1 DUF1232 domain-containing protein [Candidatus Neomarinimicrobiota bacterium]